MVKLKATNNFSGLYGSAGAGQTFEVDAATAKAMIADGYPVVEVKTNGRKRNGSVRTSAGSDS